MADTLMKLLPNNICVRWNRPVIALLILGFWVLASFCIVMLHLFITLEFGAICAVGLSCYCAGAIFKSTLTVSDGVDKQLDQSPGQSPSYAARSVTLLINACTVLLIVGCSWLMSLFFRSITWNPLATTGDLGIGGPNCTVSQFNTVRSISGYSAVSRKAFCDLGLAQNTSTVVVFVTKETDKTDASTLALRYLATDKGWDEPPAMAWVGPKHLKITVRPGDVSEASRAVAHIGEVKVDIVGVPMEYGK